MRHGKAMARRVCTLLLLALLALGPAARADEPERALPADGTLDRLIRESLAVVPELARAQNIVRAEAERVPQAGAWADPMLQIGVQNMGFTSIEIGRDPMSFVSLMASQTIPWPGKPGLKREVAELGASLTMQSVRRVRLSIEADVRRAYLALLLVRDRLQLLDQLEILWQKSLGVARVRYEAGGGAQSDVLRAQLELNRIKQRRFALQAEERTSLQALNRLRNHPLDEPIDAPSQIRDLPAPRSLEGTFSAEQALARSPELGAARLSSRRTDRAVTLAEKGYYPDVTVGAGAMLRGSLAPMWVVTIGGPLPVFAGSKQSRAVAEGRALAGAARAEVATLEQLLRLRSHERRAVFEALLQTIDLYAQGLLVQSEATAESTLAQYQVGKVSFASVLEANAGFIADEEGYLQALAAAHRVLIAQAEVSLLPVPMPALSGGAAGPMPGAGSASMEATGGTPPGMGGGAPAAGRGSASTSGM